MDVNLENITFGSHDVINVIFNLQGNKEKWHEIFDDFKIIPLIPYFA